MEGIAMKTIGILALTLLVGLGGCETMRNARDRIVRAPPRCQDATVPVYFAKGVAELTPDGRRAIIEAARDVRGCQVNSVNVMGLADAGGDAAANLELSRKRVASVTGALAQAGLGAARVETAADGDLAAVTPDGKVDPLRRRTDVTFHVQPKTK
jgi:outer membrane protein OmpA-like peptidoglycan-associated protein